MLQGLWNQFNHIPLLCSDVFRTRHKCRGVGRERPDIAAVVHGLKRDSAVARANHIEPLPQTDGGTTGEQMPFLRCGIADVSANVKCRRPRPVARTVFLLSRLSTMRFHAPNVPVFLGAKDGVSRYAVRVRS